MTKNLQDQLWQLESKQAKGAKLCANIRWELEGKKCSKNALFQNTWRIESTKSISELYTDDNKSKYSSNPKDISKSPKKIHEKFYTKETTSKASTTKFLAKFLTEKKYLIKNLIFVRRKHI